METHKISIRKTARYVLLGKVSPDIKEVWFVCHGYGQLANYFLMNFKELERADRLIVGCEGLHRFYTNGFSGRVGASWMTKEDREDDIRDYVNYLDEVYREIRQQLKGKIRVTAFGFSQGTATVCRWVGAGGAEVDRLILWAGTFPPDVDLELGKAVFNRIEKILVLGTQDEFIGEKDLESMHGQLDKAGLDYRFIRFEGKHELNLSVLKALF